MSESSSHIIATVAAAAVAGLALLPLILKPVSRNRLALERKNSEALEALTLRRGQSAEDRKSARKKRDEDMREAAYGSCGIRKVVADYEIGSVIVREYEGIERIQGVPVVEGFPAQGMASSLTANYLVEQLELPLVGEIISDSFPMVGIVSRYGTSGPCRIYGDERICVFTTDLKIEGRESEDLNQDIVLALFDFCDRNKSALLISTEGVPKINPDDKAQFENPADYVTDVVKRLDGDEDEDEEDDEAVHESLQERLAESRAREKERRLKQKKELKAKRMQYKKKKTAATPSGKAASPDDDDSDSKKDQDKGKDKDKEEEEDDDDDEEEENEDDFKIGEVRFVTNNKSVAARLKALNVRPLRDATVQGVTGGITAEAVTNEVPTLCLLTPYDEALPDVSGAAPFVELIGKFLRDDVVIDLTDLKKSIKRIEGLVKKALKNLIPSGATAEQKHASMYT